MKKITILLFMLGLLVNNFSRAANTSLVSLHAPGPVRQASAIPGVPLDFSKLSIKQIQKLIGRKLTLKERIGFKLYRWMGKRNIHPKPRETGKSSPGKTAMILGIIAIGIFFVPYAGLLSLPLGILALVLGYKARRMDPADRKAVTAIILGWITMALIVIALALAVAFVAAFSW
jgi:hypothetical protein